MRRLLAAVLAVTLLFASAPNAKVGNTERLADYDILDGHFYSQALGSSTAGFSIVDDAIPFWTTFTALGGVERLGYPISRRFEWHGNVVQATQKAVLQWNPETDAVQLVNVIDWLSGDGHEEALQDDWLVPPAAEGAIEIVGASDTQSFLASLDPSLRPFLIHYVTAPNPLRLFGLPTSRPHDFGDLVAIRFQRTVLQLWKVYGPGIAPGVVTSLNVGDILKARGVLPAHSLVPDDGARLVPHVEARRGSATSRAMTGPTTGIATWYGAYFQGRRMRNGEPYDMYDPTIAASNSHPLGSWLRVTNLSNGASVEVRVTDTGAFRPPIIVDLSWAAFAQIENPNRGVINVLVQPLRRE